MNTNKTIGIIVALVVVAAIVYFAVRMPGAPETPAENATSTGEVVTNATDTTEAIRQDLETVNSLDVETELKDIDDTLKDLY